MNTKPSDNFEVDYMIVTTLFYLPDYKEDGCDFLKTMVGLYESSRSRIFDGRTQDLCKLRKRNCGNGCGDTAGVSYDKADGDKTRKDILQSIRSRRESSGTGHRKNDIRGFRAERVSRNLIRVTVDYTYTGDMGKSNRGNTHFIYMGARLLTKDGRETGGYNPTPIWEGDNTVTLESYIDASERAPIGGIMVFMYQVINHVGKESFYSIKFRYNEK